MAGHTRIHGSYYLSRWPDQPVEAKQIILSVPLDDQRSESVQILSLCWERKSKFAFELLRFLRLSLSKSLENSAVCERFEALESLAFDRFESIEREV